MKDIYFFLFPSEKKKMEVKDNEAMQEHIFKNVFFLLSIFIFIIFVIIFVIILIQNDMLFAVNNENIIKETQPLKIVVPYPNSALNIEDYESVQYRLKFGDSFSSILTQVIGITNEDSEKIITSVRKTFNFARLKEGDILFIKYKTIITQKDDTQIEEKIIIEEIRFNANESNQDAEIVVTLEDDSTYKVFKSVVPYTKNLMKYIVTINESLYADGLAAGVPQGVILEFIKIFSFDIDFQRDLRKGDTYEVLFENFTSQDSKKTKYGDILYATLDNSGRIYEMYKYGNNYYNKDGKSVQKSLLKTPINGARISSNFGFRRHPILGYTKKHMGKDFAAPMGTPFFAAGAGTIVMAGPNGTFGNYVRIKHEMGYETEYAHASKIASGIRKGVRVRQGQTIAYIGTTGRSTGPHLHFGLLLRGERINPDRVKALPTVNLVAKNLDDFKKEVEKIDLIKQNIPNQSFKKY